MIRVSEPTPEVSAELVDPPAATPPAENAAVITSEPTSPPEAAPSTTRGVGRAAMIEVVAYGANILVRLGSNLILTRLLYPKAFGLMALFHSVNYVLWMLS